MVLENICEKCGKPEIDPHLHFMMRYDDTFKHPHKIDWCTDCLIDKTIECDFIGVEECANAARYFVSLTCEHLCMEHYELFKEMANEGEDIW